MSLVAQLKMFDDKGRYKDKHSEVLEKVKVFDNGGKTVDRYFVIIGDETYIMSHDPTSPQGVNQYSGPYESTGRQWNSGGGALGVLLDHIPLEIEPAILERIGDRKIRTYLTSSEYANFEGVFCPHCGSERIEAVGPIDVGTNGTGFQRIVCKYCHKKWYDEYKLVGYVKLK